MPARSSVTQVSVIGRSGDHYHAFMRLGAMLPDDLHMTCDGFCRARNSQLREEKLELVVVCRGQLALH